MRVSFKEIMLDLLKRHRKPVEAAEKAVLDHYRINAKVAICYNTVNQKAALQPVIDAIGSQAAGLSENPSFGLPMPDTAYFNRQALAYTIDLLRWYFFLPSFQREIYRARYYNYFLRLGQYRFLLSRFRNSPHLQVYIASNDHSGLSQIGFVAAANAGIKTVYIQHASVTEKFPPLRADYAFLEGADAADKYKVAGASNTVVSLVGAMKYDRYLKLPMLDKPGAYLGICIGMEGHNYQANLALCTQLKELGEPFLIRFHPRQTAAVRALFTTHQAYFSDTGQSALDFIMDCHTIISGESNILLEAIILKRRPIYFASDGEVKDHYGFLKNKVVDRAYQTVAECMEGLRADFDLDFHRQQAKYYNEVLYTTDEGNSTALVMKAMDEILK